MELSGSYFIYNGVASRKYGLMFAHASTDRKTALSGESESNAIYSKDGRRRFFIGDSYENSALEFDIEIITDDERVLDVATRREIEKWLFYQPDYRKLYIDAPCDNFKETYDIINGEQKQLYLNCRFVNPEKLESGSGTVGYKFTVECDSGMAWQDPVTYTYSFNSSGSSFNTVIAVGVDTDSVDYVYPKVTISMGSVGGDIIIMNLDDDPTRATTFVELTQNTTFTMHGNGINYVSGDNYMKFSNRNFIRLLDGKNRISILGDIAEIKFEFQNQRYL